MDLTTSLPVDIMASAQAQAPATPRATTDAAAARKAAEEFEGFFLSMVLDSMFSSIPTDGLFGGGHAEGVFRSLLNQQYGHALATAGGIGLADNVQSEILKLQETAS